MKTNAYKSWTAEVEVELKNNVEVYYSYPVAFSNGQLRIKATSTAEQQDAERAVREIVEALMAAL